MHEVDHFVVLFLQGTLELVKANRPLGEQVGQAHCCPTLYKEWQQRARPV